MVPFLAMALSVVNLGLNFFLIDALQDRASMAARYAALNPADVSGAKSMLLYGSQQAPLDSDVMAPPPAFMDLDESSVTVQRLDANTPSDRIVLRINNPKLPMFIPGLSNSITAKPITATVPVELP